MADHDPKTPDSGAVPDPHSDEPTPRPDAHTRSEPGADSPRPDQYEDLGPVPELFGAAGAEAATVISDDPTLQEAAIKRGAETEGVESAQIFGLLVATIVTLILIVVGVAVMMTRVGIIEEERRLAGMQYPDLTEIRHSDEERLTTYGRTDDRYRIPLERAQALMAEEARSRRENGESAERISPETRREFNLAFPRGGSTSAVTMPEAEVEETEAETLDEAGEENDVEEEQEETDQEASPTPPAP